MVDFSVANSGDLLGVFLPGKGMLHPIYIISVGEVVSSMSTSWLESNLCSIDNLFSLYQKVFKFKGFNQVSVPYVTSVAKLDIWEHFRYFLDFFYTFVKEWLGPEDCCVLLHCVLEKLSDFTSIVLTISVSEFVKSSEGFITSIISKIRLSLTRFE